MVKLFKNGETFSAKDYTEKKETNDFIVILEKQMKQDI